MSDDVFDTSSKLTSQDEPSNRDSVQPDDQRVTGLIGWFATNHVAANLIWVLVVGVGIYTLFNIKVETMPAFDTERIQVSMSYPGTSPEDIEETITVKIEEAIKDIEGIDRYYSFSNEGNSSVTIVLATGYDLIEVTNEVKAAVDSISSFPPDAYPPRIGEMTMFKPQAIAVQVSGDVDPRTLAEVAEQLRKEIIALDDVSFAELNGVRPYEIRIEISESTLQRYGLTLERVAQIIRQWSVNVSSGAIETESGSIRVRATGQAYTGEDYEQITIFTNPDGTSLKLGQIAAIHDGFVDYKNITLFNGKPSIGIQALARGEENDVDIAAAVTEWAEKRRATLPASIDLTAWASSAYYLKGHLTMMLKNLLFGAFLVFLALSVFLHLREALWVVVGLPVAFLGAVIFLPALDVTISMPSLFGFIVVIGIVVDDAIIIAESAHAETMDKGYNVASIVRGAQRVAVPATFGVLTTVAAFMPLMFATGPIKNIIVPITSVVIFCLLFSLVESKLILPSHLALMKSSHSRTDVVADWTQKHLKRFVDNVYVPLLRRCMEFRYATLSFFFMLLIGASMLVASGLVPFGFFPGGSSDFVRGEITLVDGAPDQLMVDTIDHVNGALDELRQEFLEETGDPVIQNVFAYTRNQNTEARFQLELSKLGERPVDTAEVARRWREKVGDLAHAEDLSISASQSMGSGSDLDINLRGDNTEALERAGDELVEYLRDFNGMFNVQSSATAGPREMRLAVKPAGQA
ncbi:MAG: efflux RND transporter permease subunit, partial [Pseudomonadales bacterium]|nr:efflux RND transporter permease subunit [Pseudomonadales bacterium]